MVAKDIEEKVKVKGPFAILAAPDYSWVEVNGRNELKIPSHSLRKATTLSIDGDFISKNDYFIDRELIPGHVETFHKTLSDYRTYLKILKEKGGLL
jgi:hypothetical protein